MKQKGEIAMIEIQVAVTERLFSVTFPSHHRTSLPSSMSTRILEMKWYWQLREHKNTSILKNNTESEMAEKM